MTKSVTMDDLPAPAWRIDFYSFGLKTNWTVINWLRNCEKDLEVKNGFIIEDNNERNPAGEFSENLFLKHLLTSTSSRGFVVASIFPATLT